MVVVAFVVTACTTPVPDGSTTPAEVQARHETESVTPDGAVVDAAVWVNDDDPAASLVIVTDNATGLHIHAPDGRRLDSEPLGRLNNIDIIGLDRSRGTERLLVGATDPRRARLVVLAVDPSSGEIESAPVDVEGFDFDPRAFCAARLVGGTTDVFVASTAGQLVRYTIAVPRGGNVTVSEAARLDLGVGADACVADNTRRAVWVAQTGTGIWRLPLRVAADSRLEQIARIDGRRLVSDVRGLAITRAFGEPVILASSPEDDSFAAFGPGGRRTQGGVSRVVEGARFYGRFRVVAGNDIDAVTGTHGLDAGSTSGIPGLPGGVFVVQDGVDEPGGDQNLKFIALDDLQRALE